MSGYLKRYAAPRSWPVGMPKKGREARKYAMKAAPGPHAGSESLPLGILLELRGHARNRREVVKILNGRNVMVDGRRVKDPHFPVGLMDTVSIPDAHFTARVSRDAKGRITLHEVPAKEAGHKPCKITGKGLLPKGDYQLRLSDGRNIKVAAKEQAKYAVGDTLVLEVPSQKVLGHAKLESGAHITIIGGRQRGRQGTVEAVDGQNVRYATTDGESGETLKKYVFVTAKH